MREKQGPVDVVEMKGKFHGALPWSSCPGVQCAPGLGNLWECRAGQNAGTRLSLLVAGCVLSHHTFARWPSSVSSLPHRLGEMGYRQSREATARGGAWPLSPVTSSHKLPVQAACWGPNRCAIAVVPLRWQR